MSKTKVPAIPLPTGSNMLEVAKAIKGVLDVREGYIGDPLDQNVTFRDLVDSGVAQVSLGGQQGSTTLPPIEVPGLVGGYNPSTDMTPPPQPVNVVITSGATLVKLKWDKPAYPNHSYVEVWRSETNVIGDAQLIGQSDISYYIDDRGHDGTNYFYWVRNVSQANVKGPYNSTNGVAPTPGLIERQDVAYIDAAYITAGYISADRIAVGTFDAKIANIDAAVITSGSIASARIGDGTITTAKIANYLQSTNYVSGSAGWKIDKTGNMELNSATFRGTLDINNGASGAHMSVSNSVIKVYDASGQLRVKLGDLSA